MSESASRIQSQRPRERAMLLGRERELGILEKALTRVTESGEAQTVTLFGATGVGKTRLVRDFLLRAQEMREPGPRVFRGAARDGDPAFGVFARVLRGRFGIVDGMDEKEQRDLVRARVSEVLEDRKVGDVCYFLGKLLHLEFVDSPLIRALSADPTELGFLRRAVLSRFFEADANRGEGPLVLVFDDLHFAPNDALELLSALARSIHGPVLILCLARTEIVSRFDQWPPDNARTHIELPPLSDGHAMDLMRAFLKPCGEDEAVDDLVDAACSLAGGTPAFLEQMVHVFLDMKVLESSGPFEENEHWTIHTDRLDDVRLPITVQDAVEARISSLAPDERLVLERASMMGGVFWGGGLRMLARADREPPEYWADDDSQDRVPELLKELVERDYILKLPDSTFAGDVEFVFKHNLERETLAKHVPSSSARRYHSLLADWLSLQSGVRANEESLTMLARHYEACGSFSRAGRACIDAANLARIHLAHAKACELYERGLDFLSSVQDAHVDERIRALLAYADTLIASGKGDRAMAVLREMLAIAHKFHLVQDGALAHARLGRIMSERGSLDEASKHLHCAMSLFERNRDDRGVASTVDDIGKLHWLRGDHARSLEWTKKALAMRERVGDKRAIALSLNNLGLVQQDLGQTTEAIQSFEWCLSIRRELHDAVGGSVTLSNLGTVALDQGLNQAALTRFTEAYELAKEAGDKGRAAQIATNLGEVHNRLGDLEKAMAHYRQAEVVYDELGDKLGKAEALCGLGKVHLAKKDFFRARILTSGAVEILRSLENVVLLATALRTLAEVRAAEEKAGESSVAAKSHFVEAMSLFEKFGHRAELKKTMKAYVAFLATLTDDANSQQERSSLRKKLSEM